MLHDLSSISNRESLKAITSSIERMKGDATSDSVVKDESFANEEENKVYKENVNTKPPKAKVKK